MFPSQKLISRRKGSLSCPTKWSTCDMSALQRQCTVMCRRRGYYCSRKGQSIACILMVNFHVFRRLGIYHIIIHACMHAVAKGRQSTKTKSFLTAFPRKFIPSKYIRYTRVISSRNVTTMICFLNGTFHLYIQDYQSPYDINSISSHRNQN